MQSSLRDSIGSEGVRWEDPAKFHITLQFLGEVAPDRLGALKQAGIEAASMCAPFSLGLSGIGVFPRSGPARVLWIGTESGLPEYASLAEYLEERLSAGGFGESAAAQGKLHSVGAHPHVTIARAKSPQGSHAINRALRENNQKKVDKEGVISVSNVVLFHSDLQPGGSVYTTVETFPLAAS